jgi:hypothetical protein
MNANTKKVMDLVRRRLTKTINLHLRACGRDEDVKRAFDAEFYLIDLIQIELVKRDDKAGVR